MRSLFMREDCYTLRGLCMTFIVLHHVFQYTAMQYAVHYPMLIAILMQSLGYLCTAVFFLLSGYGVHCSLAREQASCHTLSVGYVGSRLFRLLLPFLRLGLCTALLVLLCDVQRFGIGCEVPQSLTAVLSSLGSLSLPIGGNVWVFKVIIALYLLTYLVRLFTSSAQRRITLIEVMKTIVNMQRAYFLTGQVETLRPMVLQDVADKCGYDISTISRVSNSKYVDTDFGIISVKELFTTAISDADDNLVSNVAVMETLREVIQQEDKHAPLTDEKLAAIMKEKGYPIARRTVMKYREKLGFPVARMRKEL